MRADARTSAGLFRDDDWIRRVSREPALLMGGGRALLLEVAHPLVAAGVAAHSRFRSDPFGRLQRTLDAMGAITFGDRESAFAAAERVERAHARVQGRLGQGTARHPVGTPYHGRQPELMAWVWATLVDTAVVVYELFVAELAPDALDAYYAQHRVVARVLGVPEEHAPADWPAFRAYFDGMVEGDALEVTDEAREIASAVLAVGGRSNPARSITSALMPPRLREAFGLPWDAGRAARFEAFAASVRRLRPPAVDAARDPG